MAKSTFRGFDANSFEELRVGKREFDGLSEHSKLIAKTSNV